MIRLITAIIAAPILWGLLMLPVSMVVAGFFGDAIQSPPYPTSYLLLSIGLSCLYSLFAGYGAAWIAGTSEIRLGLGAGIALLIVGLGVQLSAWDTIPIWYHLIFLALLIPLCILGSRLRGSGQAAG